MKKIDIRKHSITNDTAMDICVGNTLYLRKEKTEK